MLHPDTQVYSYWFNPDIPLEIPQPCNIITDNTGHLSSTLPNVYIQAEPNLIINNREYLIANYGLYRIIYTFDSIVLEHCPNAILYVPANTWIQPSVYNDIDISKKQFRVSTLAGSKNINNGLGYLLRQTIHCNQSLFPESTPLTFFRSEKQRPHLHDFGGNPLLKGNTGTNMKEQLFEEYQFAIVVENSKQQNYFSEKLVDCLITKTIPIYYGCPNIDGYFNTTGWIILTTTTIPELIYELIDKLRLLDTRWYGHHSDVIEQNYKKAKGYANYYVNLNRAYVL